MSTKAPAAAREEPADTAIVRSGVHEEGEDASTDVATEDPAVDETRSEIRGLMDKVRQMSTQFRASRGEPGAR